MVRRYTALRRELVAGRRRCQRNGQEGHHQLQRVHQDRERPGEGHRIASTAGTGRNQGSGQAHHRRTEGLAEGEHHLYRRLQRCHHRQQRGQPDGQLHLQLLHRRPYRHARSVGLCAQRRGPGAREGHARRTLSLRRSRQRVPQGGHDACLAHQRRRQVHHQGRGQRQLSGLRPERCRRRLRLRTEERGCGFLERRGHTIMEARYPSGHHLARFAAHQQYPAGALHPLPARRHHAALVPRAADRPFPGEVGASDT